MTSDSRPLTETEHPVRADAGSGPVAIEARRIAGEALDAERLRRAAAAVVAGDDLLRAGTVRDGDRRVGPRGSKGIDVPLTVVDADGATDLAQALLAPEAGHLAADMRSPLHLTVLPDGGSQVLVVAASPALAHQVSLEAVIDRILASYHTSRRAEGEASGVEAPDDPAVGPCPVGATTGEDSADDPGATGCILPAAWTARGTGDVRVYTIEPTADVLRGLQEVIRGGVPGTAVLLAAHLAVARRIGCPPDSAARVMLCARVEGRPGTRRVGGTVPLPPPSVVTWQLAVDWAASASRAARWRCGAAASADRPAGQMLFEERSNVPIGDAGLPLQGDDDCAVHVVADPDRLVLQVRDRRGLLGPGYAQMLAELYREVLTAIAAAPGGDCRRACLPPSQRALVLRTWSMGARRERGERTVGVRIAEQAERTPEAVAVEAPDGTATYAELRQRTLTMARRLAGWGIGRGDVVGVCLPRGLDLLPVLLGLWEIGAAYLPLDVSVPAARLRAMVAAADCPVVVTTSALETALAPVHDVPPIVVDRPPEMAEADGGPAAATEPARADDLAYVMFTSGSTGRPKGVMVPHRGLTNYLCWTAETYAAAPGGAPVFSPLSFDLGVPNLFTPLLVGHRVHFLPEPFDVVDLGVLLAAGAPYSFVKLTPGQLDLLTYQLTPAQIRRLAGLVIAAGDTFTGELVRRWADLAGPGGPRVATEYGPTEITVGNSGMIVDPASVAGIVPLGAPIPNTTMLVLDEHLEPVPVGVPGEVCIGGEGVARGYLGGPEATAGRFVPDPYAPTGSRLYRSGDVARWLPDGSLDFLGRVDDQVKVRGYRVELGEIRAALRRDPSVRDAVVLARTRPSGVVHLVAYVLLAGDGGLDCQRLESNLVALLPDYMIPHVFVAVEEIPLTGNGKVDKRALPLL